MSHLSAIGFGVGSPSELADIFVKSDEQTEVRSFGVFIQHRIQDASGAQIYWYAERHRYLFWRKPTYRSFIPAFQTHIAQPVKNVQLRKDAKEKVDGSVDVWVSNPSGEEYPLIVDLPNGPELSGVDLSAVQEMNITLFAESFEHFLSVEAFDADQEAKGYKLGHRMFIPTGTFSPTDDPNFVPRAACLCYGVVRSASLLKNGVTNQEFCRIVIDTYGASYDLVVPAADLPHGLPNIGSVAGGEFWPCGTVVVPGK